MFSICVETNFKASHQLTLPDKSREARHSHNWRVIASVSSNKLNDTGFVMDFVRLKHMVDNITSDISGNLLQQNGYFESRNASAENTAEYIFRHLEPKLPSEVTLDYIEVFEQAGCSAKFFNE